ncbi:hypothetical protein [Mesorhizobium sp. M2E.F.Ca.ET.154.01.1.1]|uniref:hypothetical protein n=1 Tax=Mesorhizobium sp. M2E.F.Ca.ET.154.01.1.1 TaxID=2500521 RepID=UPI00269B91B6
MCTIGNSHEYDRETEEREGDVERRQFGRWDSTPVVGPHEFLFVWQTECPPVLAKYAAIFVRCRTPRHATEGKVCQGVPKCRKLPVEDRNDLIALRVEYDVSKTEVAVGNRNSAVVVRLVGF